MSDEMFDIAVQVTLAILGVVFGTGWYARQRWLVRKALKIVQIVVANLDEREVVPAKKANQQEIGQYDLTPEQGKEVLEKAKREIVEVAKLEDSATTVLSPSVASYLSDPERLEQSIEKEVKRRKIAKAKGFR